MGRFHVSCRRFAVLSGIRQNAEDYAICVHPQAGHSQRKGTLAVMTEPAGEHPSLASAACRLAQSSVVGGYFADSALSFTSSLRNALDGANSALLQYNHGQEAPDNGSEGGKAGGAFSLVKTRRAKVGLTAALLRPDGTGLYLAQLAPTQAYLMHNGILSAIPEPPGWGMSHGEGVVPLRQPTPAHAEEAEGGNYDLTGTVTQPLGSGPGLDVDLVYRRIAEGDLLVMVSTSLARHLDRDKAESIFACGDADEVIEALSELTTTLGLAKAHACALQMGVPVPSGVEETVNLHVTHAKGRETTANGGTHSAGPHGPQGRLPDLRGALKGPRDWLVRRKREGGPETEPEGTRSETEGEIEIEHGAPEQIHANGQSAHEPANGSARHIFEQEDDLPPLSPPAHPEQTALQRSLNIPPYRAASLPTPPSEGEEELHFDGWEDAPPVLEFPKFREYKWIASAQQSTSSGAPEADGDDRQSHAAQEFGQEQELWEEEEPRYTVQTSNGERDHYGNGVAPIFPVDVETEYPSVRSNRIRRSASKPTVSLSQVGRVGRRALRSTANVVRGLLPGHDASGTTNVGGKRPVVLPARVLIGSAVLLVAGLLVVSLSLFSNGGKKVEVQNFLQEAKQADLLANQPGIEPAEKREHLSTALQKAQKARVADPKSAEAKLLSTKVQTDLDKLDGITRLSKPKLLFRLDAPVGGAIEKEASATLTTTVDVAALGEMLVQSNDAYILDREKSKIYRCSISAQNCSAIISEGDTAGGQKVGKLAAMTLRVNNLVALDSKLTAYIFDADTSAWQAQPLGEADKLEQPKDIASYDGNLYLLGAKPGQISKYASGGYEATPTDWLKEQGEIDQVKSSVSIAIDGAVYVLLGDNKILVMEGGKVTRTISVAGQSAPTHLYTSTDTRDLYLLRAGDGSVSKITKEGQTVATYKAPADADNLQSLSGMAVDEGKGKLYLLAGSQVYEASLGGGAAEAAQPTGKETPQPGKPRAEP